MADSSIKRKSNIINSNASQKVTTMLPCRQTDLGTSVMKRNYPTTTPAKSWGTKPI